MIHPRSLLLVAFVLAPSASASTLDVVAPHAAGLELAEIEAIEKYDETPDDGCAGDRIRLRVLQSTGASLDSIHLPRFCPGSLRREPPELPFALEGLAAGGVYWFGLTSSYQRPAITRWWPMEGPHREVFERAIARDELSTRPVYEPDSELTYWFVDPPGDGWRIEVRQARAGSWSREVAGERSARANAWYLFRVDSFGDELDASGLDANVPVLAAETATELDASNGFDLPSGKYYVRHLFHGRTGAPVAVLVSRFQPRGLVELVFRVFQNDGQKVVLERRHAYLKSGGKAVGGERESWVRRTVRTLNADTAQWSERTFRAGEEPCGGANSRIAPSRTSGSCTRSVWVELK